MLILGCKGFVYGNSISLPIQENTIVCEGQKAYVQCPSPFDELAIVGTMYGRRNSKICVHPSIPSSVPCQEQETQVKAQIVGLCEGEHACEVAANNDFLAKAGTTICPDVYKYLEIKYRLSFFSCLFFFFFFLNAQ